MPVYITHAHLELIEYDIALATKKIENWLLKFWRSKFINIYEKKTQAQRKIEIFFFAIGGCELVIRNAVAKWPAASQGFKITKWPAVWYFSQILRNQRNPSSSNYHMSINDCQAIQKSCIGHNSNAWFTLSAGSKTVVTGCRSFSHSDSENKHLIKFNQERIEEVFKAWENLRVKSQLLHPDENCDRAAKNTSTYDQFKVHVGFTISSG